MKRNDLRRRVGALEAHATKFEFAAEWRTYRDTGELPARDDIATELIALEAFLTESRLNSLGWPVDDAGPEVTGMVRELAKPLLAMQGALVDALSPDPGVRDPARARVRELVLAREANLAREAKINAPAVAVDHMHAEGGDSDGGRAFQIQRVPEGPKSHSC